MMSNYMKDNEHQIKTAFRRMILALKKMGAYDAYVSNFLILHQSMCGISHEPKYDDIERAVLGYYNNFFGQYANFSFNNPYFFFINFNNEGVSFEWGYSKEGAIFWVDVARRLKRVVKYDNATGICGIL